MLYIVGIGPGDESLMTQEAINTIREADAIVGYKTYTNLIKHMIEDKELVRTGMRKEMERCQAAIELAQAGKKVALVCSGDPGVYALAGLVLEIIAKSQLTLPIKIISGVTASLAAASSLGAPLMHDFCHISLSDLLTPWPVIEKRVKMAAAADFVICFYNPRSKGRPNHLARVFELMRPFKNDLTPVGIVKNAGRTDKFQQWLTTFGAIDFECVDMKSIVIVGNQSTYRYQDLMITPRGYNI